MEICFISKYPPIEGGVSSRTYWLARGLGARGVKVHVITNAWETEDRYREIIQIEDLKEYQPKNVYVHTTDPFDQVHVIPSLKMYLEKLSSLAIEKIKEHDLELIDSYYLFPYGLAGYLAKSFTDRPQIFRHAGSDINRLIFTHSLREIAFSVLVYFDRIVTSPLYISFFERIGVSREKLITDLKISIDTQHFHPQVKPLNLNEYTKRKIEEGVPIIGYIGKFGLSKRVRELIEAFKKIKEESYLLLITEKNSILDDLTKKRERIIQCSFLPPWKIPALLAKIDILAILEKGFPIQTHIPITPREAAAMAKCIIVSDEVYQKISSLGFKKNGNIVVVDSLNDLDIKNTLEFLIKNEEVRREIGKKAYQTSQRIENFDQYIQRTINIYSSLLKE